MNHAPAYWSARRDQLLELKDTDYREQIEVKIGPKKLLCRLWVGPGDVLLEAWGAARDWAEAWKLNWNKKSKKLPGGYRVPAVLVDPMFKMIIEILDGPYSHLQVELQSGLRHLRWLGWDQRDQSMYGEDHTSPCKIPGQAFLGDHFHRPRWEKDGLYPHWRTSGVQPLDDLNPHLFPYQRLGTSFLIREDRALLADDMGLGKTPQALVALNEHGSSNFRFLALVVCPSSVVLNWVKEAKTWAPDLEATPIFKAKDLAKLHPESRGRILVVSWGMISRVRAALLRLDFHAVVADEAHYAKTPDALRTRAFTEIAHKSPVRWLLTGTPMRNRPKEIWSLLHILDPFAFPVFVPFGERYCGARWQRIRRGRSFDEVRTYDGSARLEELRSDILSFVMMRRMKRDVLPDLPPKRFQLLELSSTPAYRKAYKLALDMLRAEQVNGSAGHEALGMVTKLRGEVGLAKVSAALEWISGMLQMGEPIVIFFTHKAVAKELRQGCQELGARVGEIVGDTSIKHRQIAVEAFQAGDLDVMLCSEAAKEGITLTRSAYMLRVEYWWSPGDQEQAEDRICRIGQDRPCMITTLHLLDSLDDHVASALGRKRENIAVAMRPMNVQLADRLREDAGC